MGKKKKSQRKSINYGSIFPDMVKRWPSGDGSAVIAKKHVDIVKNSYKHVAEKPRNTLEYVADNFAKNLNKFCNKTFRYKENGRHNEVDVVSSDGTKYFSVTAIRRNGADPEIKYHERENNEGDIIKQKKVIPRISDHIRIAPASLETVVKKEEMELTPLDLVKIYGENIKKVPGYY